jgi:vacuolar-type H+-ATPase subunit D/Vma8
MANIKHTKNELKAQREALKRFQRYLPTLQLKKQQLQLEVRQLESQLEAERNAEVHEQAELAKWGAPVRRTCRMAELAKRTQDTPWTGKYRRCGYPAA